MNRFLNVVTSLLLASCLLMVGSRAAPTEAVAGSMCVWCAEIENCYDAAWNCYDDAYADWFSDIYACDQDYDQCREVCSSEPEPERTTCLDTCDTEYDQCWEDADDAYYAAVADCDQDWAACEALELEGQTNCCDECDLPCEL